MRTLDKLTSETTLANASCQNESVNIRSIDLVMGLDTVRRWRPRNKRTCAKNDNVELAATKSLSVTNILEPLGLAWTGFDYELTSAEYDNSCMT